MAIDAPTDPALAYTCPRCEAPYGEPCRGRTVGRRFHVMRLVLAEHELAGPVPMDVVFFDAGVVGGERKYRVAGTDGREVILRRGTSKARWRVERDRLWYDPYAEMWRQKP